MIQFAKWPHSLLGYCIWDAKNGKYIKARSGLYFWSSIGHTKLVLRQLDEEQRKNCVVYKSVIRPIIIVKKS